jgi:integrase
VLQRCIKIHLKGGGIVAAIIVRIKKMRVRKFKFTIDKIKKLSPPINGKQYYIRDAEVNGLAISISKSGKKSFIFWRKIHGIARTKLLGYFPDISIEQARGIASSWNAAIATGQNPFEAASAFKGEPTLQEAFSEYISRHASKKRKTWAEMQKIFERHVKSLKMRKLSTITPRDAERLHQFIFQTKGKYIANRVVQLLRAVYNKSKTWKLYSGENPFAGISLYREIPREHFLSEEEIAKLLQALEKETNDSLGDFVKLSLFTGVRKANLMSLRWDYIDWENGTLTIPDTKSNHSQTVTLGPIEIELLKERSEGVSGEGEFVFPGAGKTKHLTDLKHSWTTLRKRVGIEDCTIHDLRRSLAAGMANANINVALIKSTMNHSELKTTLAHYAKTHKKAELEAKQIIQQKWLNRSNSKIAGKETATLKRIK